MPFTAAHPALVLPFARIKTIPFSAFVIGSITPDFEYFLKMKLTGRYSHTLEGMIILDLPVALILFIVFHHVVKQPLINNLPAYGSSRLQQLKSSKFVVTSYPYIVVALLVGIASHILWDSFTHSNEFFVTNYNWLSEPLFQYPRIPAFRILQHVSTLVGGIILLRYFHKMPSLRIAASQSMMFWVLTAIVALLAFCIRALFTFEYFGDIVATAISAGCLGILASSIWYTIYHE